MPPICLHCGRTKGFYGPAGYCCFSCKADAKRAAAQAKRWIVLDPAAPRKERHDG